MAVMPDSSQTVSSQAYLTSLLNFVSVIVALPLKHNKQCLYDFIEQPF
jgi:hypothetical protein